jgi:hypothetical protein
LPYDPEQIHTLIAEGLDFAQTTYFAHYGKSFEYDLKRALDLQYKRITLVAKSGGERMTIDTDLQFRLDDKSIRVKSAIFIVETKSKLGRGIADLSFRNAHERPTKRCSKYCIGMAALGQVSKWNRFIPAMRKMNLIEGLALAQDVEVATAA